MSICLGAGILGKVPSKAAGASRCRHCMAIFLLEAHDKSRNTDQFSRLLVFNTLSFIFIASMSHGRSKSGISMKVVRIEKVVHRQVY